jgi:hypothetical protein
MSPNEKKQKKHNNNQQTKKKKKNREKSKKTKKTKCDLSYNTGPFITLVLATLIIQEAQERRLQSGKRITPKRT